MNFPKYIMHATFSAWDHILLWINNEKETDQFGNLRKITKQKHHVSVEGLNLDVQTCIHPDTVLPESILPALTVRQERESQKLKG